MQIFFAKNGLYFYIWGTLRIDLAKNLADSAEIAVKWPSSEAPELFEELRLVGDLTAKVLVSPEEQGKFLLTGSLSGTQNLVCARTLETFERPFSTEMVLEVVREQVASQELDDEDADVFVVRIPVNQEYVDVSECIRQLVILQEPMYPVKNPDENFSFVDSSPESLEDPRWEKLKALKCKMEKAE
ncbi:MAG: DUF177 domain-containing protein [Fibrobacteraceae bacterium]|jgi:uncharacterized protein|nr:DUF177 domain-containing protein [Fibrobacteraceae bacterium]